MATTYHMKPKVWLYEDENLNISVKREYLGDPSADGTFIVKGDTIALVKHLLDVMGLKYITAAEEAEAQCAYLQQNKIVDYVITEDSDIFLFGGQRVIRNFSQFSKGKGNLELYKIDKLTNDLGLSRDKCILLALLLGCDYCDGVRGIGIVNAMEVIVHFDSVEDFDRYFKLWAELPDDININSENVRNSLSESQVAFLEYHKNYKKHWIFPDKFPNYNVVKAFEHPRIRKNMNKNEYRKPGTFNKERFTKFLTEYFDKTEIQMDDIVDRIQRGYEKFKLSRITQFFPVAEGSQLYEVKSLRLQNSINELKKKVKPKPTRVKKTHSSTHA